jgi:hypothetical protein
MLWLIALFYGCSWAVQAFPGSMLASNAVSGFVVRRALVVYQEIDMCVEGYNFALDCLYVKGYNLVSSLPGAFVVNLLLSWLCCTDTMSMHSVEHGSVA